MSKICRYRLPARVAFLVWTVACSIGATTCLDTERLFAAKPNFIILVADDAGYSDYGFSAALNGRTTPNETPNLDALAQQSVVATHAYLAAPVCAPSRAGLLTGQYQQRFGFEENLNNSIADSRDFGLTHEQLTIAQYLKPLGYTTGAFGKWHLGYVQGQNRPLDKGFDEFFGFLGGGRLYFYDAAPERGIWKNNDFYETQYRMEGDPALYDPVKGRYATDAFGEEAASFINRHAAEEQPFFMYVAYNAPHTPYNVKQSDYDHFAHVNVPNDPYARDRAALIYGMDRSVGMILDALDANGIADNTYVIFLNDHGAPSGTAQNQPLRGHKGTTWEGGIRTPMVIRGPGIQPGLYSDPITAYDLLPSIVAAAGGDLSGVITDGYNVMPQLTGQETGNPHDVMFWRYWRAWAVRKGDWKLTTGYTGGTTPLLYNLALDPTEIPTYNAANREIEAELLAELARWEATLAKPTWGILSRDDQNRFDHFVFRGHQTVANWSAAGAWRQAGTINNVTMNPQDAYANAILEFTVNHDASYTANNDMKRMSNQTFMLNQFRFTGSYAGVAHRQGTIAGNAVLMVQSLAGQLPQIRLDATSSGTTSSFTFELKNEIQLLDDLEITGDGTQNFVVSGAIRDYYEPFAPNHPLITVPHNVRKTGASSVTLTGDNRFGGTLTLDGGRVLLSGPHAAIRAAAIVVGSGGNLSVDRATIDVHSIDLADGGAFRFQSGLLKAAEVTGDLAVEGGTFSPGASAAASAITGNLHLLAGTLQIELAGASPAQYDHLTIGGRASLGGTLQVDLLDGFVPEVGQRFEFLASVGGVDGIFRALRLPTLPNDLSWNISYETDAVALMVAPPERRIVLVPGDYNQNGQFDGGDYVVWRNSLGRPDRVRDADGNGDGQVDQADYLFWKSRYGTVPNLLAGDYNRDGLVDGADYVAWRNSLGAAGENLAADGNGDRRVDAADYQVWKSAFATVSPIRFGDYNQDGVVNAGDYIVWRNSLGQTGPNLAADGNGDWQITREDYILWKGNYGSRLDGNGIGGPGSGSNAPEPSSTTLWLMGCLLSGLTLRQRY